MAKRGVGFLVGLLSAFLNTVPAQEPSLVAFSPPVAYGAGSNPNSVAAADFNGDGNTDLAVANSGSNNVSVLLGKGDGTFWPAVDYATGAQPVAVAIADFNLDGNPDLAVANANGTVSVLLGNGDGTFQLAVSYPAGSQPASLAVADFNGDGKPDLAVGNSGSAPSVSVLLGNGDGTFQGPVSYSLAASYSGPASCSVAVGDFNGDGKPDLAAANGDASSLGGVSVLLGNGDGTFGAAVNYPTGTQPTSVAVGNLNGDTVADLAVANSGSNNVSVLLGNGDGTFQTAVNYLAGSGPSAVAVGKFNFDGNADLVVADANGNAASVLLGNGDGTFQAAMSFAAGPQPASVAVADFNGDGKPDLAIADQGNGVSILLNATLQATSITLVSSSNPSVSGQSITLTATVSSAAGIPPGAVTFYDGNASLGTQTLSNGVAALSTSSLNVGAQSLTAAYGGSVDFGTSASAVLQQIVLESQTIAFSPLANQTFGAPPFTVAATASSGLKVRFDSQTTAVCKVSGTQVTLVSVGTCTVQATQPGNSTYAAAAPVNQSFQVTQESQTITFGALSNQTIGAPPFTVGATASSGLKVSFNSQTAPACKISGVTVTLLSVGVCTVQATQSGNAHYAAATPVNQTFQILSQAPDGWPFAGYDLNNSRWASSETTLNNQNVGGLTVRWQFTTQNDVSATPAVDSAGAMSTFPIFRATCIN